MDVTFVRPLQGVDLTQQGRVSIEKIEARKILGFVQEFGCTADSQLEMQEMVRAIVLAREDEENAIIHFDRIGEIAPEDLESEIYQDEDIALALMRAPTSKGIWYQTGRAFYHD
ncbi:MAG: hypothetical protein ACFUZC_19735 [Chthoniobacteraceae bacterium]